MARKSAKLRLAGNEDASNEAGRPVSKSAAVRAAVDAGADSPDDGLAFIKSRFGIEMTKAHFSAVKSRYKTHGGPKRGRGRGKAGRVGRPKSIEGILSAPKRSRRANGQPDLLAAIEVMSPLIRSLGVERVKKIADLLG